MKEFLNDSWEFIKTLAVLMASSLLLRLKKELKIITPGYVEVTGEPDEQKH